MFKFLSLSIMMGAAILCADEGTYEDFHREEECRQNTVQESESDRNKESYSSQYFPRDQGSAKSRSEQGESNILDK